MILQTNDDYSQYADNVFINISGREHNSDLNKITWQEIDKINVNELSPAKIATQHIVGYSKAIKKRDIEEQEKNRPKVQSRASVNRSR